MSVAIGTRLGPYEILGALGAGGMGEVYRARDTKLGREVAIKVLPASLITDPDRRARFAREAQLLAALNHPHIAAIYHVEDSGDTPALVMELVEGETLADRIARGPIPVDEALPIAEQIAEALEAAHEQGIIHRDLKPANIKVTPDGTVKVLDFGLAKLSEPGCGIRDSGSDAKVPLSLSPTITSPAMMTGVGALLGTAAYMAPEQAKGRPADKRSDIWAFGCVLYEMLTGTRPFDGEDVTETLAAILMREPDWNALPGPTPQTIRTVLTGCLEKNPRDRFSDISAPRFLMSERAALLSPVATTSASPPSRRRLWQRVAALTAGALVIAAAVGASVWIARAPSLAPPRVSRLTITPTAGAALSINGLERDLAITPDGSHVIYVGNGGTQLIDRALDALEPVAVFTGSPRGLFVSPDGQWIGFADNFIVLKKVAVTGGSAVTLAALDGGSRGATWGPNDTIIFATNSTATGLQRVAAAGGPTTVLTRPDHTKAEGDHVWPEMLPDGRSVLFTITPLSGGLDDAQVAVLDLQTGTRKVLVRGGSHAHYVPSGHLLYAAAGTLRAVPFDLNRLETRGTPVAVVRGVRTTVPGSVDAVVAGDGTLAYVSGGGVAALQRTLEWVDREGRETPIATQPRAYQQVRLSPDGTRAAVFANDQEFDIWIWDLARTTLTRATFDPSLDAYPVWTPDGHRLIFSSERVGARNLYWQAADGTGAVERLTESPYTESATGVTPDGRRLIFTETTPKTDADVMQVDLDGMHHVTALVQSPFAERNGIVSPDGRWLAYEANDSGRGEIYVRPYPSVNSGHWQVSTGGGTQPLWGRNGQELFYLSPTGAVMRAVVERASSWAATTPTLLVKYVTILPGNPGSTYDISPDGQRFLMVKDGGGTDQAAAPPQIIVVQHFDQELKRLVPTK